MGEPTASTSSVSEKWKNAASLFDQESLEGLTRSREGDSQASEMRKEKGTPGHLSSWVEGYLWCFGSHQCSCVEQGHGHSCSSRSSLWVWIFTTTITNMNANITFAEKLLHQELLPEGHCLLRYSSHFERGVPRYRTTISSPSRQAKERR